MAITLTLTASNATPNQEDLPEVITIEASAVDSSDPSAVFAYSWHFLGTPPNTAAALANNRAAITTFTADIWGSYRLFCIAQNTSTGETSIVDPLAAPSSSFLDIEVLSENYDLVKPAKTQREWQERYWHLVDTVEGLTFNGDNATTTIKGVVELANAYELATAAGASDSTTGADFCITPEVLSVVLGSDRANGNLPSGTHNNIRDAVKNAALEKMNEVSITEMADVDTTTTAPTAGQALIWSPSHTDDSGDGDTGAWIPGDVSGSSQLFGAGLCAGETLDTGDFLIFREDCQEVPVAGPIPGWHARNRYNGEEFALNFPFASFGRATSAWHSAAEAASLGTWDDNKEAVGMVGVASKFHCALASQYDNLLSSSEIIALMATGKLPSLVLSPYFLATTFLGQSFTTPTGTIYGVITDSDSAGDEHIFYDSSYHTSAELSEIQAAVTAGDYASAKQNILSGAFSSFMLQRWKRWGITKLGDVDTTTTAPSDGDVLVWDSAHTDDQGGTGAWVPQAQSAGSGTIEGVVAGTGLTGGGTSGVVTLDVSGLTTSEIAPTSLLTSTETFVDTDSQLMTAKAILDLIQDNVPAQSITHTFEAHLGGSFTDEVTYNASSYSIGVGRSPVMFMFKNPHSSSLNIKDFSFTCSHMHSDVLTFSFVVFTRADLLANNYTTSSVEYTMTKTNIDVNTNNEGIGNVENSLGIALPAGSYIGLLLNGYEKTGQDNQRWHLTIECNG